MLMESPAKAARGVMEGVHMSVNSISGLSSTSRMSESSEARGGFRAEMKKAMDAVASKLGMNVSDLQAQLKSGKSLTDIAGAKGVSANDLLSTIKQSLSASGVSGNSLDAMATRIANHKGGGHHRADNDRAQAAASAASTTGTSAVDKDGDNDGS
ncbi:hypothetical protein GALL_411850 [mine drainage metagenome]|uniref:Uncharacterized protein n=1 Tax=mine drainage metagenome TaxID=410659 RepID=A0A1J5Q077_9ZZZZ